MSSAQCCCCCCCTSRARGADANAYRSRDEAKGRGSIILLIKPRTRVSVLAHRECGGTYWHPGSPWKFIAAPSLRSSLGINADAEVFA